MAMKVEIRNKKLCIEIDLDRSTPAVFGKTFVVASTRGNVFTNTMIDGMPTTIDLKCPDRYFMMGVYFSKECLISTTDLAHR